jgi:arginyl-tRNA synthetase
VLHQSLEQRLLQAVQKILPDVNPAALCVRPCPDPEFGDYQTSSIMALAKERRLNPRQLAADVVAHLDVSEWCEPVAVAGAGFINFRIKAAAVARVLSAAARGEHLFFRRTNQPRTMIIDFSSPNVAKPMHVGHIRSTILGDCLARTLELLGHRVIRDNHIGDWGTQFGMLIVGWLFAGASGQNPATAADPIGDLEQLYKLVSSASHGDPQALALLESRLKPQLDLTGKVFDKDAVANLARAKLVALQSGDPACKKIWDELRQISQKQFDQIYQRLGVRFDYALGESFYNSRLPAVVDDLISRGIATVSEGAKVVFFAEPQLKDNPAIIQKSDGGYNYTTTDLATLEHRLAGRLSEGKTPDEIVYVTDGRQQLHFQQLFAIFRRWRPEAKVKPVHVWFGSILGNDGKPFRTRSGETVKLADLLDESEERAFKAVSEKNPDLSEAQRREIARMVGLGALKYADLLPNRQSDYVFSWEKMLALNGNTAPYLQYAHTRIASIFRKAEATDSAPPAPGADVPPIHLSATEEITLAKHLLNFGLVLSAAAEEYRPNYLCNYLYDLAGHFARFYETCPVLKAAALERASRLKLCELTARVLRLGLEVLGIETPEQM